MSRPSKTTRQYAPSETGRQPRQERKRTVIKTEKPTGAKPGRAANYAQLFAGNPRYLEQQARFVGNATAGGRVPTKPPTFWQNFLSATPYGLNEKEFAARSEKLTADAQARSKSRPQPITRSPVYLRYNNFTPPYSTHFYWSQQNLARLLPLMSRELQQQLWAAQIHPRMGLNSAEWTANVKRAPASLLQQIVELPESVQQGFDEMKDRELTNVLATLGYSSNYVSRKNPAFGTCAAAVIPFSGKERMRVLKPRDENFQIVTALAQEVIFYPMHAMKVFGPTLPDATRYQTPTLYVRRAGNTESKNPSDFAVVPIPITVSNARNTALAAGRAAQRRYLAISRYILAYMLAVLGVNENDKRWGDAMRSWRQARKKATIARQMQAAQYAQAKASDTKYYPRDKKSADWVAGTTIPEVRPNRLETVPISYVNTQQRRFKARNYAPQTADEWRAAMSGTEFASGASEEEEGVEEEESEEEGFAAEV